MDSRPSLKICPGRGCTIILSVPARQAARGTRRESRGVRGSGTRAGDQEGQIGLELVSA